MAGNSAFELVSERGWRRGLGNLWDNEFSRWWRTRLWWVQALIWVGIIGFMLAAVIFGGGENLETGVTIYSIFASLGPGVGVIILMQDVVVGEKLSGTAAWVLSKPASRSAFILSKLAANSLGVLLIMVLLPGIVAYGMLSYYQGQLLNPTGFLAAMGVLWLSLMFYLTFTLMLGCLFNSRGAVIGLGLALLFLQQYLVGLVPILGYMLPWSLSIPANGGGNGSLMINLLLGRPLPSILPLLVIAAESVLFVLVGLYRFEREEL